MWVICSKSATQTWSSGAFFDFIGALEYMTNLPTLKTLGPDVVHHIKFIDSPSLTKVINDN